jgi:peptide deformylase
MHLRLKIVQAGDPVLRTLARPLAREEIASPEIQRLIESMRETMWDAPGVGLAAPQVGLGLQIAVIEDKAEYTANAPPDGLVERERQPVPFHVIINPKVVEASDETVVFVEGCLSLAGFAARVPRQRAVTVECLDHTGAPRTIQASGWYARILQHEIDHLNGKLYIDRMYGRTFSSVENLNRFHGGVYGRNKTPSG